MIQNLYMLHVKRLFAVASLIQKKGLVPKNEPLSKERKEEGKKKRTTIPAFTPELRFLRCYLTKIYKDVGLVNSGF